MGWLSGLAALFTKASVPFWLRVLPYAIAVLAALGWFWQYTATVKLEASSAASREVEEKWEKRISEFDHLARQRVDAIWRQSSNFASNAETASRRQAEQVRQVLAAIDVNAPSGRYLEIRDGQCVFRQEYIDAFNSIRNTLPGEKK